MLLALVYVMLYQYAVLNPIDIDENKVYEVRAQVSMVRQHQGDSFVHATILKMDDLKLNPFSALKFEISLESSLDLNEGDKILVRCKLRKKRWRVNFGVHDLRLYAHANGLQYRAANIEHIAISTKSSHFGHAYQAKVHTFTEHYQFGWLYQALLSGNRSDMPKDIKRILRNTGTLHLLAISGLHISLIFLFVLLLVKVMFYAVLLGLKHYQHINSKRIEVFIALAVSGCFVYLCALPISAQRAWLMLAIYVVMHVSEKQYSQVDCLLYAFVGVFLINPFAIFDAGLWYSFSAVAVIFITLRFTVGLSNWLRFVVIQLALSIILLPLTLALFSGVAWGAPIFNLIAVPLVSLVILPLVFIAATFGFSSPSQHIFTLLDSLLSPVFNLPLLSSDLLWFSFVRVGIHHVVLIYLLLVTVCWFRRSLALYYAILLITAHQMYLLISQPDWQVDVLDVGHGLVVVVSQGKQALVYDLGPMYFDQFSIVNNTLLPFISAHDFDVRYTIISHDDNDHNGGLEHWLVAGFSNTLIAFHPDGNLPCKQMAATWGILRVESLWPRAKHNDDNANSCVVKISDGHFSLYLTGDITEEIEMQMLTAGLLSFADIVVSPHHGSKTSSSTEFIQALNPQHVIHSSGHHRIWNMPHREVVERYASVGATQWQTKHQGSIRVTIKGDELTVTTARDEKSHWFIKD